MGRYPDRLIPFVHVDPRAVELYDEAGRLGLAVVIHFEHWRSNSGFARFDEVIGQCPQTTFIGHAQTWWANIETGRQTEAVDGQGYD